MTVDPVVLEVARNRLASVADEMGVVLRRTAYSPNIKERADCSAAVFVPDGEMLAQAEHIPVHLGSMPASVAAVLDRFGTDLQPGTQYAVNDPYHGGTHLNDLTLVRPVHVAGRLVGWVANRAHHADVGGEAPGSMPAHAVTVDQEGIVVPPMAAVRDGEWLSEFVEPFLRATRTPAERLGDLSAQLGANEAGAERLAAVVSAAGADRYRAWRPSCSTTASGGCAPPSVPCPTGSTGSRTSWSGGTTSCRSGWRSPSSGEISSPTSPAPHPRSRATSTPWRRSPGRASTTRCGWPPIPPSRPTAGATARST